MADDIRSSSDRSSIGPSGRRNLLVLSLAALAMVGISAQAQTDRKAFSPEELVDAPIAIARILQRQLPHQLHHRSIACHHP